MVDTLIRWYVDANGWYVDCSTERVMLCAGVLLIWSISLIYWVWFNVIQCDTFLNTHAPRKTKIWPNSHQFMTKAFRKAIMTKSKKSKIRKMVNNKKQWNFCTNLLGKTKQKYFCNLNIKDLNYNKRFLKKNKTFFRWQRFTD